MLYFLKFSKGGVKQFGLFGLFLTLLCFSNFSVQSQLINGNAFLRGNFVEMAVGPCGTFSSNIPAPSGYHPRGPVGNFFSDSNFLGFVADPARDGWNVGSPNYVGDYFLPGSPEEGFGISVNGYNYNNNMICNETGIQGSIIEYGSTSNQTYATWQGSLEGLSVKARTFVPVNGVYFITEVSITNTSVSPAYDVYYMRNVDPDQGVMTPGGNGYETLNSVDYQNPEQCNRALVSSTSLIGNYYLGLGSIDSRARVTYGGFANRSAFDVYNGYGLYTSGSLSDDIAIAISFKLGTIEPNQTVKFAYAYILNRDQLSAALSETNLNYTVNGLAYSNNTSVNTCSGVASDISINSPSGYSNWTWTPTNGLSLTSPNGQSVSVNISSPVTYTVTGSGVCGTVTLNIPVTPVRVDPPGAAGPISGATVLYPGQYGLVYNTSQIANATNYIWTIPPGFVSTSSNTLTSTEISLNGPNAGGCGQIKVYGKNACGNGPESSITVCVPGITTGSLSTAYSVNALCSPLSSSLYYSSSNIVFQPDNYFTVELSNANGDFSIPYYIGSYSSSQTSGLIPIYIPSDIQAGYGYRMRIISSNPYYVSTDNGMGLYMSAAIPVAPTSITQELVSNNCGGRIYRYTANGPITDTIGYRWTIPTSVGGATGVFVDSGDFNSSRVILVKYTSNLAAGTTDSIKVRAYSGCGYSATRSARLINTLISAPSAPSSITITPVTTNVCGGKLYRYSGPSLVAASGSSVAATGWQWSFSGTLGSNATIDSGTLSSQIIRVKFTSNNAAASGDSVRLAYTSSCGNSALRSAALTNTLLTAPAAPASITITQITNDCNSRVFRYAAPALLAATSTSVAATGWQWVFVGPLNSSTTAVIDSGTLTSQVVRIKYLTNSSAYAGDSVRVAYTTSSCGISAYRSSILNNTFLGAPAAPASITTTLVSASCGNVLYRYAAPALIAGTSSTGPATGWAWAFLGNLGANAVIDSGTNSSQVIRVKFTSSAAAAAGDSVRVCYTTTGCGNSLWRTTKLSNTTLAAPTAPASITITAVSLTACDNKIYRYTAPALTGTASGWQWSFVGNLGLNATLDSGSLTSQIVRMKFTSNVAATTDSAMVMYTSSCGNSPITKLKLTNTALTAPAAPASVTSTAIVTNVCGGRVYRYTAPVLPAATATAVAASGYIWSFTGPLHATGNYVIDSGTVNSRIIRIKYSSNAAASTTDSVRVLYTSGCGNTANKSLKLTHTLIGPPLAPASVTSTAIVTNVCGGRVYRYTAPTLPAATTTAVAATGYVWSFTGPLHYNAATGAANFVIDSGTINSRIIRIKYLTNVAASTTDSARVCYTSSCGNSPNKSLKLTIAVLNAPAAPATLTITQVANVCSARVYRYTTSALVAATTTAGAATGWQWSFVGTLGLNATVDSGTLTSQTVRMKFTNNGAATTDSARVAYNSGCGLGTRKTAKLTNTALTCLARTIQNSSIQNQIDQPLAADVFPNPSLSDFEVRVKANSIAQMSYRILDSRGAVVERGMLAARNAHRIGSNWKPGVYVMEIIQDGKRITKKIIKQ